MHYLSLYLWSCVWEIIVSTLSKMDLLRVLHQCSVSSALSKLVPFGKIVIIGIKDIFLFCVLSFRRCVRNTFEGYNLEVLMLLQLHIVYFHLSGNFFQFDINLSQIFDINIKIIFNSLKLFIISWIFKLSMEWRNIGTGRWTNHPSSIWWLLPWTRHIIFIKFLSSLYNIREPMIN